MKGTKMNWPSHLNVKPPVLLVLLRATEICKAPLGMPDGNAAATKLFKGLVNAVLAADDIFVHASLEAGYFNESFYLFELVDVTRPQAACAVVAQLIHSHTYIRDFAIVVFDEAKQTVAEMESGSVDFNSHLNTAREAQDEIIGKINDFIDDTGGDEKGGATK